MPLTGYYPEDLVDNYRISFDEIISPNTGSMFGEKPARLSKKNVPEV
jgi:hypothetical protein